MRESFYRQVTTEFVLFWRQSCPISGVVVFDSCALTCVPEQTAARWVFLRRNNKLTWTFCAFLSFRNRNIFSLCEKFSSFTNWTFYPPNSCRQPRTFSGQRAEPNRAELNYPGSWERRFESAAEIMRRWKCCCGFLCLSSGVMKGPVDTVSLLTFPLRTLDSVIKVRNVPELH